MAGKNTAVFGIYPNVSSVEQAVDRLKSAGFRNTDISVLLPENVGNKDLATIKATKAPEGAAAGAGSGIALGGVLGWLAGIGALAIPGVGPLIAAGPIVGALAGAGAGGAVGALTGTLVGMGIPEYEAKRFEGRVKEGGILLSVHSDNSDWTKKAKDILENTGAKDVSSTGEASADYAETDRPVPRGTSTTMGDRSTSSSSGTSEFDSDYRRDFQTRYTGSGYDYSRYEPAYQFGAVCARDARFQNRDWNSIEPDVRRQWEAEHGSSAWDEFKDSIRFGWEKIRGRRAA
jgi:hypothetical protein